jgi:hypothetical protein
VIGSFEAGDGDAVAELHRGIDAPIVRCDVASAEMIKLAANAALMTRISFINEIANVCEATGADVVRVAEGVGPRPADRRQLPSRRHRLRRQLLPQGLARLKQLAANSGLPLPAPERGHRGERAAEAARDRKLQSTSARCAASVALLGLAFKPNTDDMREAPSLVLAGRLLAEGADVRAWDPIARVDGLLHGVEQLDSVDAAIEGADAAVLVTEWPELREIDWAAAAVRMRSPLLIDGRNMLDPDAMRAPAGRTRASARRRVMDAVILVGGEGTRLRPLTAQMPKADAAARRPAAARLHVRALARVRRFGVTARDRLVRLPPRSQIEEPLGDRYGELRLEYQNRGGAARHLAARSLRGPGGSTSRSSRMNGRLAARDRPRRARRIPPEKGDTRDDPAHAGRGSEPLRARARPRRRSRAQLPREAAAGGDRHEPDQRRPVRPRAGRARA